MPKKVVVQRIVSSDGRTIAEAKSEVITSDTHPTISYQSVTVNISSAGATRGARSCSSSSTSQASS